MRPAFSSAQGRQLKGTPHLANSHQSPFDTLNQQVDKHNGMKEAANCLQMAARHRSSTVGAGPRVGGGSLLARSLQKF